MPDVAAAITKQTRWHGVMEEFDNVYYFNGPEFEAGNSIHRALVDYLVAEEKKVHGTNVEFMTARVWSAGGSIIQNVTKGLYDLDGFGTINGSSIFKEAAVMVEWECDRVNVLGRKVYLRKFLRSGMLPGTNASDVLLGASLIPQATKDPYKLYADRVQRVTLTDGTISAEFALCSPSDRQPRNPSNGVVNDYLISREFRRN